ncbi:MAG TPA: hypothetical protein VHY08_11455, partial [Bacillota bacterium]|nr:hypothetical protein [Bacillota bacterium]
ECLFGKVINGQMILNDAGQMVEKIWLEIPIFYPGSNVDAFQIMPNHFHGIILVGTDRNVSPVGAGPCACPVLDKQNNKQNNKQQIDKQKIDPNAGQSQGVAPTNTFTNGSRFASTRPGWLSLPDVVHRFKTLTTTRYISGVKCQGWRPFNKRLWQRNYYEHIVRNPLALGRIRRYIMLNPIKWKEDIIHPLIHSDPDAYYQQLFKNWEEGAFSLKAKLT